MTVSDSNDDDHKIITDSNCDESPPLPLLPVSTERETESTTGDGSLCLPPKPPVGTGGVSLVELFKGCPVHDTSLIRSGRYYRWIRIQIYICIY